MVLKANWPAVLAKTSAAGRVLDVGGWFQPLNRATHVLDIGPFETRRRHAALDPEHPERFSGDTWIVHDVCNTPWPFPDKFFDFAFCSHLLEDVRDPLGVCRELIRTCRGGYIETPSRLREIFSKSRFFRLKSAFGNVPELGFYHHRWFVELDGTHLRFTAKTTAILQKHDRYITRRQLGRKLDESESGLGFFWEDQFTFEEAFVDLPDDYASFRRNALARVAGRR